MISEEYDLTGKKNNPIELTGSIKQVEQLKATINIPTIYAPPVTTQLEITPTSQKQNFFPPENTYFDKVICNKIPNEYVIPSGQIDIIQNGIYDVTNYASVNVNTPSSAVDWSQIGYESEPQSIIDGFNYAKTIQQNWDNSITSCYQKYYYDRFLEFFPLVDTSNVTNFYSMFEGCTTLLKVPKLNLEKAANVYRMYSGCQSLQEVGDIDIKTNTNNISLESMFSNCGCLRNAPMITTKRRVVMNNLFQQCYNLENVPQFNLSTSDGFITIPNGMFTNCPKLTNESLNNIMGTFVNIQFTSGTKTLRNIGFSSEQATICTTLSNWSALQSAGWTTGY